MTKLSRLAVVLVIMMLAALVTSGCGQGKPPCKLSEATKTELKRLNVALNAKSVGAVKPPNFALTEMKRSLMGTFPKVYGLSFEEIYERLKDLDAELEAAIKDDQTGAGPTDALIRAKRQKDGLRNVLLEEGGNVPDEVFAELEMMNARLTELIDPSGATGPIDFMLEEKRNLMFLFPEPYNVPFPDVYRSLNAIDDQLDRARALGDDPTSADVKEAYRAAEAEKKKLEEALRAACK